MTKFPRPIRATGHCRHYSYNRAARLSDSGPCCALGVDLSGPGSSAMCMPERDEPRGRCSQREEYTQAEHDAWEAFYKACICRLSAAVRALPAPIQLNTKGHVFCPNCGGQLHYARWHRGAAINCTTENCAEARFSIEAGANWPAQLIEDEAND